MPNINTQLLQGSSISGKVTDPTGKALQGIEVNTYSNSSMGHATTDAEGSYTLKGLIAGTYNVQINATSYNSNNNTNWVSTTKSATIVQGQTMADINAQLIQGSSISGKVTDSTGKAIQGIDVNTFANGSIGYATTDAGGNYTLNGLTAGTYNVLFSTTAYNAKNKTNWLSNSKEVTVIQGQTMADINAQLN